MAVFGLELGTLIVLIIATAGLGDYLGFWNIMPVTKKTAGIIGVIALVAGGSMAGWWSLGLQQTPTDEDVAPSQPELVKVNIIDSDSADTHITEESDVDGYWKTEYYWDSSSTTENFNGDDSQLDLIKADIDLIWNAATSVENDVNTFGIKVGTPVPVVENEDDSSFDEKKIFDYDSTEDTYNIKITPAGGSTQRMEAVASVSPGGSKTVTIEANLDTSSSWGKHVETYDTVELPVYIDTNANISDGYEVTRTIRLMRVAAP